MADDYNSLNVRVHGLEQWRGHMESIELPSFRESIKNEIPNHYTKRIAESEIKTLLQLGNLIDEKLDKRFGWMPRILEGTAQAIIIVIAIYWLGLA